MKLNSTDIQLLSQTFVAILQEDCVSAKECLTDFFRRQGWGDDEGHIRGDLLFEYILKD